MTEVRVWVLYYDAFGDHGVCNVFGALDEAKAAVQTGREWSGWRIGTPDEEWSGRGGYRIAPYTVTLPDAREEL
jgi:hypothetical protein